MVGTDPQKHPKGYESAPPSEKSKLYIGLVVTYARLSGTYSNLFDSYCSLVAAYLTLIPAFLVPSLWLFRPFLLSEVCAPFGS